MTDSPKQRGSLLRILGLVFGVAAVVGGMIGQGILRTPGIVAGAVHSPELTLALWVMGAALLAVSAFAYAELGTAIPCAGGPYDYARRAFGPTLGVVTGWAAWLVIVTVAAFLAIVVAEFLHRLGVLTGVALPLLAVGVLVLFGALNWTGTRISGDSQIAFSAFKGAALVALVILLFAQPGAAARAPTQVPALGGAIGIAAIATALRAIMNTYDGWQDVVYFSEELKDPGRTLPRSIALGIASVVVLYLLVNVALLHVLTPAQMAVSELPAADAAAIALGPAGGLALTVFGVISVAAIANVTIMKSARIAYALARAGHLPSALDRVAPTGTPRVALAASVLLAAAFAATGTYETVVAMNVAVGVAVVIVVNLAVVRLRRTEPAMERPFRVPLYPIPIVLAVAVNLALLAALVVEDPVHSLAGFALLAALGAGYRAAPRLRRGAPVRS
jgi:APA family basic amino acid/polyamine antiporter